MQNNCHEMHFRTIKIEKYSHVYEIIDSHVWENPGQFAHHLANNLRALPSRSLSICFQPSQQTTKHILTSHMGVSYLGSGKLETRCGSLEPELLRQSHLQALIHQTRWCAGQGQSQNLKLSGRNTNIVIRWDAINVITITMPVTKITVFCCQETWCASKRASGFAYSIYSFKKSGGQLSKYPKYRIIASHYSIAYLSLSIVQPIHYKIICS